MALCGPNICLLCTYADGMRDNGILLLHKQMRVKWPTHTIILTPSVAEDDRMMRVRGNDTDD